MDLPHSCRVDRGLPERGDWGAVKPLRRRLNGIAWEGPCWAKGLMLVVFLIGGLLLSLPFNWLVNTFTEALWRVAVWWIWALTYTGWAVWLCGLRRVG